jgi:hypothetical protein
METHVCDDSNLTQIDWNAMINCAEGRWTSTCSTPVINVQGGSTTTLGRGVNKFYLTDLRAMRTWVSSICMPSTYMTQHFKLRNMTKTFGFDSIYVLQRCKYSSMEVSLVGRSVATYRIICPDGNLPCR